MCGDGALRAQEPSVPGELVARLEAAFAGSRELDLEIAKHFQTPFYYQDHLNGDGSWSPVLITCARVTTSIDAALALAERVLAPPYVGPISLTIMGSGQAFIDNVDPCGEGVGAFGNTPALSLCIAILKATAASSVGIGPLADEPSIAPPSADTPTARPEEA